MAVILLVAQRSSLQVTCWRRWGSDALARSRSSSRGAQIHDRGGRAPRPVRDALDWRAADSLRHCAEIPGLLAHGTTSSARRPRRGRPGATAPPSGQRQEHRVACDASTRSSAVPPTPGETVMWPRWNTRPIVVPGFAAPPVKVVAGTRVAGKAPFIRALNTVAATIRFRSAVPDPAASALRVGRPHSVVATGRVGRPPGRSPPAPQAPLRPCACGARRPPRTVRAELAPLSGGLLRAGGTAAGTAAAISLLVTPRGSSAIHAVASVPMLMGRHRRRRYL